MKVTFSHHTEKKGGRMSAVCGINYSNELWQTSASEDDKYYGKRIVYTFHDTLLFAWAKEANAN